ncbi:MAG: hypothetical protein KAZ30_02160 [Candidatus Magasanikbacteria bacterium]|nr:hypothetical protein [Candidatus Magasanikbacteria bacterium]
MILQAPLYVFLFTFFGFLVIFGFFIAVNFYHIFSSGTITLWSFIITVSILAATIFILFGTFQALSEIDWQQPVTLLNIGGGANDFFPESSL